MKIAAAILALTAAISAQEIDRIAAVVNQRPITQSQWEQQERFEALSGQEEWTGIRHSRESLERLIDRALILDQMERAHAPSPDTQSVSSQLSQLRRQLHLDSDSEWQQRLKRYGLLESDVAEIVREQAAVLRFVDARFRPAVHVSPDDVTRYYRDVYLPQFKRTARPGTPPPTPAQVQPQIITILTEQRINDLFSTWLKTLRAQANIRRLVKEAGK